jgi:hypothetical protein
MWSLGCVAAELFLGLPLFPAQSPYDLLLFIKEKLRFDPGFPDFKSPFLGILVVQSATDVNYYSSFTYFYIEGFNARPSVYMKELFHSAELDRAFSQHTVKSHCFPWL